MNETFVYVISASADRHKIGHARDPADRRAMLQCGSYDKLTVIFTKPAERLREAPAVERGAHYLLRHLRHHGEWFTVSGEEAIGAVERAFAGARAPGQEYPSPSMIPPLGIRPPDELRARIEAYAAARGITRHAAMLELIEAGLRVAASSFAGTTETREVRK